MRGLNAVFVSTALAVGLVVSSGPATASTDDLVPIPGGIETGLAPPYGPILHVFAPGPTDLGFMGVDVEPNTITNFDGVHCDGALQRND